MKNFLIFTFFACSTFMIGTGIEKMNLEISIFGLVLLMFSMALLFQEAIEETCNEKSKK